MKFGVKKLETSLYRTAETHFDVLNYLGMAHECDGQTDGQTERPLAIARSNRVYRRVLKTFLRLCIGLTVPQRRFAAIRTRLTTLNLPRLPRNVHAPALR